MAAPQPLLPLCSGNSNQSASFEVTDLRWLLMNALPQLNKQIPTKQNQVTNEMTIPTQPS